MRVLALVMVLTLASCTTGGGTANTSQAPGGAPATTTTGDVAVSVPAVEAEEPTLTVVGEGLGYGVPDRITVTMAVSVLRPEVAEAASVAAQVGLNVTNALVRAGVAAADIQSSDYTVMSESRWDGSISIFEGFRVRHTYLVKMPFEIAGRAIDAAYAESWDALEIQYTRLYIEDEEELNALARVRAWADCEETARQLAENAGMKLGRLVSITEGYENTYLGPELGADGEGDGGTSFEPGRIAIQATIEAVFVLEAA